MKNKHLIIPFILFTSLSLCSCSFIMDFFNSDGGFIDFGNSSARIPPRISDIPTPPPGDTNANRANVIYGDVVDHSVYPMSCTPSLGKANFLVIPVWFKDSNTFINPDYKEKVREDINSTYFGTNEVTGWRSVKSYYEEESLNSLEINGKVTEWFEINKSYTDYAIDDASGAPKTSALVKQATDWYFVNHSEDPTTNYDQDGDGYLDGVVLIYAAPDYGTLDRKNYDNLWAYCFWIQDYRVKSVTNPGVNVFFWASYDFMYGPNTVSARTGKSHYYAGDTSHASLDAHTFIHETGHMFGLEDYYDYSSNDYLPAGSFSMQDHNVGGHDPFSSFALGWGKAYVPIETTDIDLKPFSTSGEMIILSPSWNEYNSPFDEYLILEYYTPQGLNEFDASYKYMDGAGKNYPFGSIENGIRLWHVDARLLYTLNGQFSADRITSDPTKGAGVVLMMSNTYTHSDGKTESYLSPLGRSYSDYNLLQLIRNSSTATYRPKDFFDEKSLFKADDAFSMNKYSRQFVNGELLNSKKDLGFMFKVNACNNNYASISITKL